MLTDDSLPRCRFGEAEAGQGRLQRDQGGSLNHQPRAPSLKFPTGTGSVVLHLSARGQILRDAEHIHDSRIHYREKMAGGTLQCRDGKGGLAEDGVLAGKPHCDDWGSYRFPNPPH